VPRLVLPVTLVLAVAIAGVVLTEHDRTEGPEGAVQRIVRPVQSAVSDGAAPVGRFFRSLFRAYSLDSENERLEQRVGELQAQIVHVSEVEAENERLRALLNYAERNAGWVYLSATVIGRDPSNLIQSISVDRGTNDGVREGMVVVASGGLVGKVTRALPTVSKVLLITDPSSAVNAMIERSRAKGIVRGGVSAAITMDYVGRAQEVAPGDIVLTSGLGGGFPKGLLIGQVRSSAGDDLEMFQQLDLEPAVRFHTLEEVLVITNFEPTELE